MPDEYDQLLDSVLPKPRASNYDEIINRHAQRTGLDPTLIKGVMSQESSGNPRVRSPKGASGLMQLMPGTARRFGVKNINDPEENIRGGTDYLRFLTDRYKGNIDKVLAGYNSGEGNVDKYNGIPPFRETQNYVPQVKARIRRLGGQVGQPAKRDAYDDLLDEIQGQTPPPRMQSQTRRPATAQSVPDQTPFAGGTVTSGVGAATRPRNPRQLDYAQMRRNEYARDPSVGELRRAEDEQGQPSRVTQTSDELRVMKGEQPVDRQAYSRQQDAQVRLSKIRDESNAEREAREQQDKDFRRRNQGDIDRLTKQYRAAIKSTGIPQGEQWTGETLATGLGGIGKLLAGVTGAESLRKHSEALQRAAMEEGANRDVATKLASDVVGGFIATAPELAAMRLGVPPVATFAAGSALRAGADTSDPLAIAEAAGQGGATGLGYEVGAPTALRRALGTGAATAGIDLASGASPQQALVSGATNALMRRSGEIGRRGDARQTETQRQGVQAEQPAELSTIRESRIPIAEQSGANSQTVDRMVGEAREVTPQRFYHRDYGEVIETESQVGARKGKVRVAEVDNPESVHYVRRSDLSGKGNQRLVPIKASEQETAPQAELTVSSPSAPPVEVVKQPEIVKPWEMRPAEIEQEFQRKKSEDDNLEASILGPELAKKYARLQRSANSSYDAEKANRASDEIEKIEASLSERDRNRLYGIGETGLQVDEWRDYRQSIGNLDDSSPQALGESMKWATSKLGSANVSSDPAKMTHEQQVAYGTLREAARIAHENGWDTQKVSEIAVKAAGERFSDPEDARMMLDRFIKKEAAPTRPAPKQITTSPTRREVIQPSTPATKGEPDATVKPTEAIEPTSQQISSEGAGGEPPAPSKVSRPRGQAGGVDVDLLTLGIRPFAKDVASRGREAVAGTREIADGIKSLLAPPSRSEQAQQTSRVVRANAAEMARAHDIADKSLEGARKYFSSQKPKANYEFIDRMERGQAQPDPKTQQFADTFRQMLDERRDRVQALGTGQLESFIEDYFPHIWKDPKKARDAFMGVFSKRPFEGSKSFLKKRTLPLTSDGLKLGLEPVSNNPVDLAVLKLNEMDRYLMAHQVMGEMKDQGNLKFFKVSERIPDGWKEINDRVATVFSRSPKGELILRGRYAAPESAAKIVNNYLSPGLNATAWRTPFRAWRATSNVLNQFQLGFSAFHAGFTTVDAMVSRTAAGLEDIVNRRGLGRLRGVSTIASTPLSPITNLSQGSKMLREWYSPGSQGAEIGKLVDAMVQAGGRARMDRFYTNSTAKRFMDTLRQGNIIGAAIRAPGATVELLSKPVMEWLVPRQKMGVFADLAKRELERLGPDATQAQVRHAMAKAWDSVDNRMGQLTYDNLFWNTTLKDLSMASVRSVGWNIGTLREVGGGLADFETLLGRAIDKKSARLRGDAKADPLFTHRMAYTTALPLVVGAMGALTQYLATGKGPQELKDYFFPKTGALDENGNPERISFPSYMKDVIHAWEEPGKVVTNKLHPLIGVIAEMLRNEDYYGTKIRNEDDPLVQQFKDVAEHAGESMLPFSVRGYQKETERGGSLTKRALPFVGITPAPSFLNKSPAEKVISEKAQAAMPQGSRTQEQADRSRLRHDLQSKARRGEDITTEVNNAIHQSKLKPDDAHDILRDAKQSPLQLRYKRLPLKDALEVWDVMTAEERSDVKDVLAKKAESVDNLPLDEQEEVKKKLESIGLKDTRRPQRPERPERQSRPSRRERSGFVFQ